MCRCRRWRWRCCLSGSEYQQKRNIFWRSVRRECDENQSTFTLIASVSSGRSPFMWICVFLAFRIDYTLCKIKLTKNSVAAEEYISSEIQFSCSRFPLILNKFKCWLPPLECMLKITIKTDWISMDFDFSDQNICRVFLCNEQWKQLCASSMWREEKLCSLWLGARDGVDSSWIAIAVYPTTNDLLALIAHRLCHHIISWQHVFRYNMDIGQWTRRRAEQLNCAP